MKHKSLALLVALLILVPTVARAQANVRCESDGNMKNCSVADIGSVRISNQLSRSSCIQGETWGYSSSGIWVDKDCRADFIVTPASASYTPSGTPLQCESSHNRRHTCVADTRFGVQISRQLSSKACVMGKTWGYTTDGVWVDHGCSAEFLVLTETPPMASSGYPTGYAGTVTCESMHNGKKVCAADTHFGVQISRQLGDRECELNRNWGFDSKGIWVDKGCRAEFMLGHP